MHDLHEEHSKKMLSLYFSLQVEEHHLSREEVATVHKNVFIKQ